MAFMHNLNHLAFAFGMLGNVISGLVFLSPIPTFYRIYKKKSTEGFSSLPYLVALFSSTLWLYYALILKKDTIPLITINSVGCFIETIYVATFIIYATRNARILTVKHFMALNVASFIIILFTTQVFLHDPLRVKVLGWICTAFSICVFVAPLSIMREVYRTKSVKYMPFNLSLFLTLSAIVWFAYGFSLGEINIYLPNVVGVILGMLQMILYGIYRNGEVENKEVKNKEVHPIVVEDHHVNIEVGKEGAEEEISVVEG